MPDTPSIDPYREAIRLTAAGVTASNSEENIFLQLTRQLAHALGVESAMIGLVSKEKVDRVNLVAFYFDGKFLEPIEYDLENTPCEDVVQQDFQFYPENTAKLFGGDSMLQHLKIEGYAGIPLYHSSGRILGLMSVLSQTPLQDRELTRQLLEIFSVRASLELERMHANQEAKEISQGFLTIFNSSVDAVCLFSNNGKVLQANPAFMAMIGYPLNQDVADIKIEDFIPPENMHLFDEFASSIPESGHVHFQAVGRKIDDSRIMLDIHGVQIIHQGQTMHMAILRDVTEKHRQEEALRKSEDRYRATIEAALDCIVSMDQAGNIVQFNAAAERTFGYRREDIVGKSLAETIIPPTERQAHNRGLTRYLNAGQGRYLGSRIEVSAMRADGSIFPAELAIDVAEKHGDTIFIGFIRDVTEQKKMEEERGRLEAQLRQAQKMEAIGHLTGGVAHDFNNILTGVMGYVVMAQEWAEKQGDEKLERYLDRAQKSGQRARDLIQQMLTFSRGQRGEARPLQLIPLIKENVKLLESSIPSSIEVILQHDTRLPLVMVDPVHIGQILMNLCINARDAIAGNGTLTISLTQQLCPEECVCSSCRSPISGTYVALSVQDSGKGIPQKNQDRIFEPFFSTKEIGKGSGMGLSTVHGIVHEVDGHIVINSEPGKGANFTVLFPICEQQEITDSAGDYHGEQASPGKLGGQILLVDDDPYVTEFMQDRLEDWGLTVSSCNNGLTALDLVKRDTKGHGIYLLDYTMPKMTGLQLAEEILTLKPDAKIILYSGYSEGLTEEEVKKKGLLAFIKKPIDMEAMHSLLLQYL